MPPVTCHQGEWNIELLQYYGRRADDPVTNFLDILPIVFNYYCGFDSWTLRLCIDNFFWLFLLGVFSKLNWPLFNFTNSFFTIGVLMVTFPCATFPFKDSLKSIHLKKRELPILYDIKNEVNYVHWAFFIYFYIPAKGQDYFYFFKV